MASVATKISLDLLDDEELAIIRGIALKHFGFELSDSKRTMLSRRMLQFAREQGATNARELIRTELVNPTKEVLQKLAVFLTTNHTFFHRESQHFDRLVGQVIPEMCPGNATPKEFRLWCAASSSGQEPYELAMCIEDVLGSAAGRWERAVLGTDISEKVLKEAKAAIYTEEQVSTLPAERARKYLERRADSTYLVKAALRSMVSFGRLNLLTKTLPFKRRFHVVFCRNVMIYFTAEVRLEVLRRLVGCLVPGGYLFIGRSESARGLEKSLRFVEPGVYQKVGA